MSSLKVIMETTFTLADRRGAEWRDISETYECEILNKTSFNSSFLKWEENFFYSASVHIVCIDNFIANFTIHIYLSNLENKF